MSPWYDMSLQRAGVRLGSGDLGSRRTQNLLLYITRFITFIALITLLDLSTVE